MIATDFTPVRRAVIIAFGSALIATSLVAQGGTRSPISIGDYPDVAGIRINFRDRNLGHVNGVNITVWTPYEPMSGRVRGIALGLPVTGAEDITGFATGLLGLGASRDFTGIGIAPVGIGAGNRVKGIVVGGIGVGTGGSLEGVVIGGIGAGAGGDAKGIILGGIGAGVAGRMTGLAAGLIGVGAGGGGKGVILGGVGAGIGGDFEGIGIGGVGIGVGGNVRGLLIGGIGLGVGGTMRGIAIGGIGVGASELIGFAAGGIGVGAHDARALVLTPGFFRIENGGSFRGVSINAAGSMIKGTQHGIVIGLFNYARRLDGMQVGLINIIDESKAHRVLPFVNWGRRD